MSKKKVVLSLVEKAARAKKPQTYGGWPPCVGIFHQPKRPIKSEKEK